MRLRGLTRNRAGLVVNLVIAAALVLVVLMAWRAVRSDAETTGTSQQTATVDSGTVTASVSASGNVKAETTAEVAFEGEGGTVTAIHVEPGDKVTRGQALATVDQTSARQNLSSARAQLAAAQAGYDTTAQGRTSAQVAQDRTSVLQSQQSLDTAEISLRAARQTYALQKKQLDAAVRRAQRALAAADTPEARSTARSALVQARESRDSQLLSARQQITQQEQSVRSARTQLAAAQAQVAVNAEGPTEGELASAQAQVTSAQVSVDQAEETLEETTLRAPMGGTVAAVNGAVGESSSSAASSSSTGTTTGSSTGTSTSGSSGFVTLTTRSLEVTAYVAEADIADVQPGQSAVVTLSATGKEVTGKVTHVDTVETVTNNVVEYGVTVRLDQRTGVRLGATAQLVVTTGEKEADTRVSSSALTTIGDRTTATVRHDDGTTETVVVTTGLEGDSQTEVLSGLSPGDVVVLPDQGGSGSGGLTFPAGGPGGGLGAGVGGGVGP